MKGHWAGGQRSWPSAGWAAEWPGGVTSVPTYKPQKPQRGVGLKPSSSKVTRTRVVGLVEGAQPAPTHPPSIIPDKTTQHNLKFGS